jgi:hypothetical protein
MFISVADIYDWMTLKYDSNLYKSKSLTQNISRLCVKKNVLKKLAMSLVVEELKATGIPSGDIRKTTTTYIDFALSFSVNDDKFNEKLQIFISKLKENMSKRFAFLLKDCKDDNLQSLIIKMLDKKDLRLKSVVHYASKHGSYATFDLLEKIDNVWNLPT